MTYITQQPLGYTPDSISGMNRLYGTYIGVVKANQDAQNMGRLQVFIPDLGGDPEIPETWYTVGYASPFCGATDVEKTMPGADMSDTQIAYGWWAVPPDINNQVLCCFVNGDPGRGYWFGCIFQQFMNHMVPGIASGQSTNQEDMQKGLPPVCEYNKKDPQQAQNFWQPLRPTFTPLKKGLDNQGLNADAERGPSSTSARREAPSQVFGFSSPRSNTIHIDDNPQNEFIRLRTRSGAQILIHESTGYIYMISREGNSWMEISDIGIDMYSKRSISLRAEENINLHADSCVITHGVGAVHTTGGNVTTSSKGRIHDIACGEIIRHSPRIKDNSKDSKNKNGQSQGSPGIGASGATGPSGNSVSAAGSTGASSSDGSGTTAPTQASVDQEQNAIDSKQAALNQQQDDAQDQEDQVAEDQANLDKEQQNITQGQMTVDYANGQEGPNTEAYQNEINSAQDNVQDAQDDHDEKQAQQNESQDQAQDNSEAIAQDQQNLDDRQAANNQAQDTVQDADDYSSSTTNQVNNETPGQSADSSQGHVSYAANTLQGAKGLTGQGYLGVNSQCASLTRALTDVGPSSTWQPASSSNVLESPPAVGTAIATFNYDGNYGPANSPGGQSIRVDGIGSHTGIYEGGDANGFYMLEQYNGSGGANIKYYPASGTGGESASRYYVIK